MAVGLLYSPAVKSINNFWENFAQKVRNKKFMKRKRVESRYIAFWFEKKESEKSLFRTEEKD